MQGLGWMTTWGPLPTLPFYDQSGLSLAVAPELILAVAQSSVPRQCPFPHLFEDSPLNQVVCVCVHARKWGTLYDPLSLRRQAVNIIVQRRRASSWKLCSGEMYNQGGRARGGEFKWRLSKCITLITCRDSLGSYKEDKINIVQGSHGMGVFITQKSPVCDLLSI